jgi:hypothetical protein
VRWTRFEVISNARTSGTFARISSSTNPEMSTSPTPTPTSTAIAGACADRERDSGVATVNPKKSTAG